MLSTWACKGVDNNYIELLSKIIFGDTVKTAEVWCLTTVFSALSVGYGALSKSWSLASAVSRCATQLKGKYEAPLNSKLFGIRSFWHKEWTKESHAIYKGGSMSKEAIRCLSCIIVGITCRTENMVFTQSVLPWSMLVFAWPAGICEWTIQLLLLVF